MDDRTRMVLQKDHDRPVFVEQGRVYRRAMPWTPTIHALLRYLGSVGFRVPTPLDILDGWEILSFVPGASGSDAWKEVASDQGLIRFARLLREYHDAVAEFVAPHDARWAFVGTGEIICHNDFAPWNTVWEHGDPVAVLDWDFAAPGAAIDDVAYAARYVVPFHPDAEAMQLLGYKRPPERAHRLRTFAESYGDVMPEMLYAAVIARQRKTADHIRQLGGQGIEPQQTWVREGRAAEEADRAEWTEQHESLFF